MFDWAGTTIDYGCRAPVEAFTEAFASRGVEVGEADVRAPMGRPKRDHLAQLLSLDTVADQWSARHGRAPGEEDLAELYGDLERLMDAAVLRHADLLPGGRQPSSPIILNEALVDRVWHRLPA